MATKKETEDKKDYARVLYMSGEQQAVIADKVGVSRQTVGRWVTESGWDKRRAAQTISRPELVNKLLHSIDQIIEDSLDPEKGVNIGGDQLAKLAAAIEKLDKKAGVVDAIETFIAFGKWLQFRAQTDREITPELMKAINKYQDLYVSEQLSVKA